MATRTWPPRSWQARPVDRLRDRIEQRRALAGENVGKTWTGFTYEVGLEKIREYANAIGESGSVHHSREAARDGGFREVVRAPMLVVVYSAGAMAPLMFDPDVGMDFTRMRHGSQEFVWGEPVCAG